MASHHSDDEENEVSDSEINDKPSSYEDYKMHLMNYMNNALFLLKLVQNKRN